MAPQKRMMLKADVNRIYDEEVYSEQKIREEKFFVRPTRQRKMKKGKLFSVGMGLDLPFCIIILVLLIIGMIMMLCLCLLQSGRQLLLPCKTAHFCRYRRRHNVCSFVLQL